MASTFSSIAAFLLLLMMTEVSGVPVAGDSKERDEYQLQSERELRGECPVVDCQVFEEILECPYSERVGTYFTNNEVQCMGCRKCSDDWTQQHNNQDGVHDSTEDESAKSEEEIESEETQESNEEDIRESEEKNESFFHKAKEMFETNAKKPLERKTTIMIEGDSTVVEDLMKFLKNAVGSKLNMRVLQ